MMCMRLYKMDRTRCLASKKADIAFVAEIAFFSISLYVLIIGLLHFILKIPFDKMEIKATIVWMLIFSKDIFMAFMDLL